MKKNVVLAIIFALSWQQADAMNEIEVYEYEGQKFKTNDLSIQMNFLKLKKDADSGDADAQLNISGMYSNGDIIPQDNELSLIYLTKSASSGNEIAIRQLEIEKNRQKSQQFK